MCNTLKKDYHRSNCYTFAMLADMLCSENVEVLPVEEDDWENWDAYLDMFYMRFQSGTVQCNHIFSVAKERGETVMSLREVDGEEIKTRKFKQGKATLKDRRPAMKETTRNKIPFPGVKEIKQVELFTKRREYVPEDYKDEMCPKVKMEIIKQQRLEKRERKAKRQKKPDTIKGDPKGELGENSEIELKHQEEEMLKQSEEATDDNMNIDDKECV
jgi:hypothetical protein